MGGVTTCVVPMSYRVKISCMTFFHCLAWLLKVRIWACMHNVSSLKIKSAILLVMCSKSSSLISPFKKYSILIGKGPVKPRILLSTTFSSLILLHQPRSQDLLLEKQYAREKHWKLQSRTKVLAHLPTFALSVREFISSSPSPSSMLCIAMKLSLLVYNIAGRGKGSAYSSDTITVDCIYPLRYPRKTCFRVTSNVWVSGVKLWSFRLILGVKTCDTHQWRKTKKTTKWK